MAAGAGSAAGHLGTGANGTFFAALAIRSRNRELLLPLILFPIFIPALLAWCRLRNILTGESDPWLWIKMLTATTSSSQP